MAVEVEASTRFLADKHTEGQGLPCPLGDLMTGIEILIWTAFCCFVAGAFCILAHEDYKTAKMQDKLLKEQLEVNRRWNIINKHTRRMSERISEIHRESHERWLREQAGRNKQD